MNWNQRYVVSKSLVLQVAPQGLTASNSVSRPPQQVAFDAIPVLLCFARPAAPRDALESLRTDWELDTDGFEIVVRSLIEKGYLTPVCDGRDAGPLVTTGFASVISHHYMLRDNYRVMSYKAAISANVSGKSVVEVGCGTGILSIFAAKAGATKVTAIEETAIAEVASEMFAANGCESIITLRRGNSRDIDLDEPADVLIHEIIGTDPFLENILPLLRDARRRFLHPGGRLLPHRLEVFCIGIEVEDKPYANLDRALLDANELGGMYGLDFTPLTRRLAMQDPRLFRRNLSVFENGFLKARILTEECRLLDIDLYGDWDEFAGGAAPRTLEIREAGTLGAVVLYFKAHLDETTVVGNGPFVPVTSWGRDVRELPRLLPVQLGGRVPLSIGLRSVGGRQTLAIDLA